MRTRIVAACALALFVLAGCAAAMPGYVPDKGRNRIAEAAAKSKGEAGVTTATDGSYVPSAAERGYNCRRLTGIMQLKIQQVRDSEANPSGGLISSMMSQSTPRHTATGAPSAAYSPERAQLAALNNLMAEKNCGRFDLDAALKPGNTDTPEPIGAPKGKPKLR
ncbi:MAG: hypothetical protein J0I57_02020 [Hyphomicrobium sp.]|nr:hypothetical protein [Hyphomicrobium sp.]